MCGKRRFTKKIDTKATGARLKFLMKEKKISIEDITVCLDVTPQAVYCWRSGEKLPSVGNLFLLGQLLGSDVHNILVSK